MTVIRIYLLQLFYYNDMDQIMYININEKANQRTNGPVNPHLISWPCKAQNIQNLENIW